MEVFLTGAGIGLLVFIVISIVSATTKKAATLINPSKDLSQMTNVDEVKNLAYSFVQKGRVEEATLSFKRVLELSPNDGEAGTFLGRLLFEKDKELSFRSLKLMEDQIRKEGKPFDDPEYDGSALNYYMLGYFYNESNDVSKANYFKELAYKDKTFSKQYNDFCRKYAY